MGSVHRILKEQSERSHKVVSGLGSITICRENAHHGRRLTEWVLEAS